MILVLVAVVRNIKVAMVSSKSKLDVVLGILVDTHGRLLLSQRPEDKPMPGFWEIPGGKVEKGETSLDALHRELHEELGISFTTPDYLNEYTHDYDDLTVKMSTWVIKLFSPEPHGAEGQIIQWLAYEDACRLNLLKGTRPILHNYFSLFVTPNKHH